VKHFGTIDGWAKALLLRGARYEAAIWRKRKIAMGFKFSPCGF
jgi:hypothetical protein